MYSIELKLHYYQLKKLMELVSKESGMTEGTYIAPDSCIVPNEKMGKISYWVNGEHRIVTPSEYFEERLEKIVNKKV